MHLVAAYASDPRVALDRLIYWSEAPVDVAQAQALLASGPGEPPPAWCVGLDFPLHDPAASTALSHWAAGVATLDRPRGVRRQFALAAYPHVAYVFLWPAGSKPPAIDRLAPAARQLADGAQRSGLPRPAIGLGTPAAEWPELRRSLQRATVGYRLAWLRGVELFDAAQTERAMTARRPSVPRSAPLLAALGRHDRAAARTEARRVARALAEAYFTPIATLRTRLITLLLRCGEAALAAGLTEHQVDRWADHKLRSLWSLYSLALIVELVVESIDELTAILAQTADERLPRAVAAARSLLAAAWNEDLSAAELAREVGVSPSQLSRLFNRHLGSSVPEHRNALRIEHARRMLATTGESITATAFACGFNNLTHFHRVFTRLVGMPPSAYRREAAAAKEKEP